MLNFYNHRRGQTGAGTKINNAPATRQAGLTIILGGRARLRNLDSPAKSANLLALSVERWPSG